MLPQGEVFRPTEAEFEHPNFYIRHVISRCISIGVGIAKIIPPKPLQGTNVDFDRLKVTPSEQPLTLLNPGRRESLAQATNRKKGCSFCTTSPVEDAQCCAECALNLAFQPSRTISVKDFRKEHIGRNGSSEQYWATLEGERPCTSKYASDVPWTAAVDECPPYKNDSWNIKKLTQSADSFLADIHNVKGMTVPWLYAGEALSTFTWHCEDGNLSSISFHFQGEPKRWYGIPASDAEKFEQHVAATCPTLCRHEPDPIKRNIQFDARKLSDHGIMVHTLTQEVNEFIVTLPGAYHAGFNQGFNITAAINLGTAAWLPRGLNNMKLGSKSHPISYDRLLFVMGRQIESLDQYRLYVSAISDLQKRESEARRRVNELYAYPVKSLKASAKTSKQCRVCSTWAYLSYIRCATHEDINCLSHAKEMKCCDDQAQHELYLIPDENIQTLLGDARTKMSSFEDIEDKAEKLFALIPAIKEVRDLENSYRKLGLKYVNTLCHDKVQRICKSDQDISSIWKRGVAKTINEAKALQKSAAGLYESPRLEDLGEAIQASENIKWDLEGLNYKQLRQKKTELELLYVEPVGKKDMLDKLELRLWRAEVLGLRNKSHQMSERRSCLQKGLTLGLLDHDEDVRWLADNNGDNKGKKRKQNKNAHDVSSSQKKRSRHEADSSTTLERDRGDGVETEMSGHSTDRPLLKRHHNCLPILDLLADDSELIVLGEVRETDSLRRKTLRTIILDNNRSSVYSIDFRIRSIHHYDFKLSNGSNNANIPQQLAQRIYGAHKFQYSKPKTPTVAEGSEALCAILCVLQLVIVQEIRLEREAYDQRVWSSICESLRVGEPISLHGLSRDIYRDPGTAADADSVFSIIEKKCNVATELIKNRKSLIAISSLLPALILGSQQHCVSIAADDDVPELNEARASERHKAMSAIRKLESIKKSVDDLIKATESEIAVFRECIINTHERLGNVKSALEERESLDRRDGTIISQLAGFIGFG